MIVTCEQCETQFQLDDSKVPESGIRVRCSRCKFAFFVESPQKPDTARADDLAREALARDSAAASRERSSNLTGLEDGESDWQFNEEIDRTAASDDGRDDLVAAQEAVDDLLGSTFSGSGKPAAAPAESADRDTASEDRIDLGRSSLDESIDLGGSDLEVEPPSPSLEDVAGAELDLSAEPAEDLSAIAIDYSNASDDSVQPVTPAPIELEGEDPITLAAPDRAEASDDRPTQLGDPDDWKLTTGGATPKPSSVGTPIGRLSRSVPEEVARRPEAAEPVQRRADDGAFDVDAQTGTGAAWVSRVRGGVGWALVVLMCAYAGVVGLWPRALASEVVLGAQPVPGLVTDGVRGSWFENAAEGPIYVVSGELRATSSAPLPAGSLLRVRLLGADGAAIGVEPAAVGPHLSENLLRDWSLQDLQELQEAGAARLAWSPLAPGERRAFHAIVGRIPPAAVAFDFQVASAARPAQKPRPAPDVAPRPAIE